jgi:hypothetical protein
MLVAREAQPGASLNTLASAAPIDLTPLNIAAVPTGAADRGALNAAVQIIKRHPDFGSAKRAFARSVLQTYDVHWLMRRLMHDTPRFVFLVFLVHLDWLARCGQGGGATQAELIRILTATGFTGASRVKVMTALMRLAGGLRQERAANDQRVVVLRPTEKLLDAARQWLLNNLRAIQQVCALPGPAELIVAQPGLIEEYFSGTARAFLHDGFTLIEDRPEIAAFTTRDCGYIVLMQLIANWQTTPDGERSHVPITAVARRYGVSRSHLRSLLRMAEEQGVLELRADGGRDVALKPAFAVMADRWISLEFAWMAGKIIAAYARLKAAAALNSAALA